MANQEPYKIRVKLTRAENASFFGVTVGDVVELAYEDYVKGVVPSEMGNPPLEAAKAQAIAARTYAWPYVKKNEAISDASQTAQAYRAPRAVDKAYGRAHQGVTETQGLLLTYNRQPLSSCP